MTIRASDRAASERFYDTVLAAIGVERPDDFSVAQADDEFPVTGRLHVGFVAPSREAVDALWRTGTEAGYESDGEPGPRPQYSPEYYGGFLRDPDGNSAEAVHRGDMRHSGVVDHLWIRVADLPAARRFYEQVGQQAGFRLGHDSPERARFGGEDGSFSLLPGPPTEHLHMAFASRSDEDVAALRDPDGNNIELVHHNRE